MRVPHIYIVGQTASGKTARALELATFFKTEILNADSLMFYKDLSVGTAKPTKEELLSVRHHMVDLCAVGEDINAADYAKQASKILEESDKNILCVGGSGFYIDALDKGLLPLPKTQKSLVEEVNQVEDPVGELLKHDPESLKVIAKEDLYRVKRALQVFYQTGKPLSQWKSENKLNSYTKKIAFHWERGDLLKKVTLRTKKMLEGLLEETQMVLKNPQSTHWRPLKSVGYKEACDFLEGFIETKAKLEEQIIIKTMQLAKRQKTWFKKDKSVKWFSQKEDFSVIRDYTEQLWEMDQWRV